MKQSGVFTEKLSNKNGRDGNVVERRRDRNRRRGARDSASAKIPRRGPSRVTPVHHRTTAGQSEGHGSSELKTFNERVHYEAPSRSDPERKGRRWKKFLRRQF